MRLFWGMKKKPGPGRRVCVLASGGIDSAVLTADLLGRGYEVYPLYVRCGLYWENAEIFWLKRYLKAIKVRLLRPLTLVDAPVGGVWGKHWSLDGRNVPSANSPWDSVFLPGRNLLLLAQAGLFSCLQGIDLIAQGVLKGNPFEDAAPRFRKSMEETYAAGLGAKIKIIAPYSHLTKTEVAGLIDRLPLEMTFSCLRPRGLAHCGKCSKCKERLGVGQALRGIAFSR